MSQVESGEVEGPVSSTRPTTAIAPVVVDGKAEREHRITLDIPSFATERHSYPALAFRSHPAKLIALLRNDYLPPLGSSRIERIEPITDTTIGEILEKALAIEPGRWPGH